MIDDKTFELIVTAILSILVSILSFRIQFRSNNLEKDKDNLIKDYKKLRDMLNSEDISMIETNFMFSLDCFEEDFLDVIALKKKHEKIKDKIKIIKLSFPELTKENTKKEILESSKNRILIELKIIKKCIKGS